MNALVEAVRDAVANECHRTKCRKEGCAISLRGAPAEHVVVDLDCDALRLGQRKRCDYVFVGAEDEKAWVAPMEMKKGGFRANEVVKQLQGGAAAAGRWIPEDCSFAFVPVLVHGKGVRKEENRRLRAGRVTLRNQTRQIELVHCGETLRSALGGT